MLTIDSIFTNPLIPDNFNLDWYVSDNYFENMINTMKFISQTTRKDFLKRIDPDDWVRHKEVTTVNAFYDPITNSMKFPVGIFQGLFFNEDLPHYMNFGAIGSIVGHEITHGFDNIGRQHDKEGQ